MRKREIDSWEATRKKKWLEEHFLYEVRMLNFSVDRLRDYCQERRNKGDIIKLKKNMALDNFVIHARNLAEFLFVRVSSKYCNCVRASDFTGGQSWNQLGRQQRPKWVNDILDRGSGYVEHLTSSRAEPVDREGWEWTERQIDLAKLVLDFLKDKDVGGGPHWSDTN